MTREQYSQKVKDIMIQKIHMVNIINKILIFMDLMEKWLQ